MAVYSCEDGSVIPDTSLSNGRSDCMNSGDEKNSSVCSHKPVGTVNLL